MKMLLAARVDPAGMITFFTKIQKEEGAQPKALTYLSSHPMPAERIGRLKAMAAARTGPPAARPAQCRLARPHQALLGRGI